MSNRAELVRRLIAYDTAAKAIRDALKAEGELEHRENETVTTHRLPFATLAGSQTQDALDIRDQDAFMAWLAGAHPTEVVSVTVQVVRNPEWLTQAKESWARITRDEWDLLDPEDRTDPFPAIDIEGTAIPGAYFSKGGRYVTTSVTPKAAAKHHAARAAARGIQMGDWSELEKAITDPHYLTRRDQDE